MESALSEKRERLLAALRQIENSILLLQEWNKNLQSVDDYLDSTEGTKNLAASCMLIEAIGESFKKIDQTTEGKLLSLYPEIPWNAVKGIRNRIAHGYFEIDADIIYEAVKKELPALLDATRFFIERVSN